jgi:hypothetical protein
MSKKKLLSFIMPLFLLIIILFTQCPVNSETDEDDKEKEPAYFPIKVTEIIVSPATVTGSGTVQVQVKAESLEGTITEIDVDIESPSEFAWYNSSPKRAQNLDQDITDKPLKQYRYDSLTYNATSGYWEGSFKFEEYAESGEWIVSYIKKNEEQEKERIH